MLAAVNPAAAGDNPRVAFETDKGMIVLELYPDKAPATVKNFLDYVDAGHYNGTIFHRVIPNFMIQGGGMAAGMKEKPTRSPIKNEADNGLKNERGTIAMARTQVPDSATAQFFINTVDNDFLNFKSKTVQGWGYTVFGKVVEGMDVVDAIAKVKTGSRGGHQDVPVDTVMIIKAERSK
jgi:peptidyl-prolyl cis-trans isomerase B (cyclophilin B)